MTNPLDILRHHVTGAIQRGEAVAITERPVMKLVIERVTNQGAIVPATDPRTESSLYRVHDLTYSGPAHEFGQDFIDPWGAFWRLTHEGESVNNCDALEKWS